MDNTRELLLALSDAAAGTDNPLSWFEDLYSKANRDDSWIPWSDGNPNPLLVDWVIGQPAGKALVVGSGLGEDAAFLEKNGMAGNGFRHLRNCDKMVLGQIQPHVCFLDGS